jgi:hypothetical protein
MKEIVLKDVISIYQKVREEEVEHIKDGRIN